MAYIWRDEVVISGITMITAVHSAGGDHSLFHLPSGVFGTALSSIFGMSCVSVRLRYAPYVWP